MIFRRELALIYATPLEEIDIDDLPDAKAGQMIGFIDVFPCGLAFYFSFQGQRWAADDQHCVQPKCSCGDTILSFFEVADGAVNSPWVCFGR